MAMSPSSSADISRRLRLFPHRFVRASCNVCELECLNFPVVVHHVSESCRNTSLHIVGAGSNESSALLPQWNGAAGAPSNLNQYTKPVSKSTVKTYLPCVAFFCMGRAAVALMTGDTDLGTLTLVLVLSTISFKMVEFDYGPFQRQNPVK